MATNESYNEGYEDAIEQVTNTHIPVADIIDSIDKFLDKITSHKDVFKAIVRHFQEDLNFFGIKMETDEERAKNLDNIIQICQRYGGKLNG